MVNNLSVLKQLITPDNVNMPIFNDSTFSANTVLEQCVQTGYIEGVHWILEQFGSNISKQNIVEALTRAISESKILCVEYILRYCTKDMINTRDRYNERPLRCGICMGDDNSVTVNILKMLIDKGARVDMADAAPPWVYEYDEEVKERRRRCNEKCRAILAVFKKKKAPRDMTKWMVKRWIKRL